jgi:hypothetical protein
LRSGLLRRSAQAQPALRKKMVQQLVIEESKHEAVEEICFRPTARKHLSDGDDLAGQTLDQEQEGKAVLDQFDKLSTPSQPAARSAHPTAIFAIRRSPQRRNRPPPAVSPADR